MKSKLRLRWLALLLLGTATVSLGVYWWRLSLNHETLRTTAIEQASKRAGQLADVQAQHIEALLVGIDLSLRQFRDAMQAGNKAGARLIAHNVMKAFPSGAIVHVSRIDEKGFFEYSTATLSQPIYVGDRDYFSFHRQNQGRDQVFVNKPIFSRSVHQWVILVTRPIYKNGRFDGAAFISLSPEYFSTMLRRLSMGPHDFSSVIYNSGAYLARSHNLEEAMGKSVSTDRPFLSRQSEKFGTYNAASTIGRQRSIFAWHRLDSYPLVVAIGLDEQTSLAPVTEIISQNNRRSAFVTVLVALLTAGISILLWRASRQQETLENSEAMLRSTLESTEDGILVIRSDGTLLDANHRFFALWHIPQEMRSKKHHKHWFAYACNQLCDPDTFQRIISELNRTDEERSDVLHFKDGRTLNRYTRSFLHGGDRVRLWSFRDITVRQQAETQLRLVASVFSNSQEGIFITDADNRIVDVNPGFARITGYEKHEVIGQDPGILASGRHEQTFYQNMWASLQQHDFWRGEIWNRRKNGELFPEMLSISVVRDESGKPLHYIGVFSDISHLQQHVAELDRIAHYDVLTSVPNRRLLTDRLAQAIARSRRSGKLLGVCCIDLDSFKPVNDKYGHGAGDLLLIEIVNRLQGILRAEDTLARLGGDEFVLLLNDIDSHEDCTAVLNRVLSVIHAPASLDGIEVRVTGSIGITLFPEDDSDSDTLLRHADQAMYRAKEAGKNCFRFFDPEHDRHLKAQIHHLQRIGEALRQNEFLLYYQPMVNLLNGEVVGVEALIRWRHPEDGLLPPSAFMPYIDNSELESEVGDWVIASALDQLAVWHSMGHKLSVSVNIGAHHLLQPEFRDRLALAMNRHPKFAPGYFEMEIVEAAALNDIERASTTLANCAGLGVSFSIDDFGTGYSSLAYFRRLPVDTLKIDQSFVRDMLDDQNDLEIVHSVVRLANAFNRKVIAEGVETLEHGAQLLSIGCHLCQGYGIAHPMPPEMIPAWLAQWRDQAIWETLNAESPPSSQEPLSAASLHSPNSRKR